MVDNHWFEISILEQLGNIGSEIGRAVNWDRKANREQRDRALERGLELIDLTISDERWSAARQKELCRMREVVADTFYGDREYKDTPEKLEKYFYQYAVAARKNV